MGNKLERLEIVQLTLIMSYWLVLDVLRVLAKSSRNRIKHNRFMWDLCSHWCVVEVDVQTMQVIAH